MIRSILYIIAACFLFLSCNFKEASIHFVVDTPAGWVRTDTVTSTGEKKALFRPAPGDTDYDSGARIAILGNKMNNIDEFMNSVYSEVRKQTSFYREERRAKTTVNGHEARWIDVRMSFPATPDVIVEQKSYFVADRGMIFMIICSAPDHVIILMKDKLNTLLNSFKTETDKKQ